MRRRGFTAFEVQFAYTLLAGLALGAVSLWFILNRMDRRDDLQVAAREVAQRLVLQFLDNPNLMPDDSRSLPVQVNGRVEKFWYRLDNSAAGLSAEERIRARQMAVTIEVYKDINGRRAPQSLAAVTHRFDPFALADDESSTLMKKLESQFTDEPEIQALLQSLKAQMIQDQQLKQQQIAPPPPQAPADTSPK